MLDVVPNHMGYEERFKHYDKFVPFNRPEHYHEYCRLKARNLVITAMSSKSTSISSNLSILCPQKNHMNQTEVEICRLCGLPDLNQTVPYVRDTLYQWIRGLTERYDRKNVVVHHRQDLQGEIQQKVDSFNLSDMAHLSDMDFFLVSSSPILQSRYGTL